jgi:hypothetical protein
MPLMTNGRSEIPVTAAELHGSYYEVIPSRVLAWANFPLDVSAALRNAGPARPATLGLEA